MPRLLVVVPRSGRRRVAATRDVLVVREEDLTKCHAPAEVAALRGRASYVTLSPVAPTSSKPGYGPALGVVGVREAAALAPGRRFFALGGVTPANARAFLDAGAHGVAVMGPVLRAEDPAAVIDSYLAVLR